MAVDLMSVELSNEQFSKISRVVNDICGIQLPPGKEGLVKSRLMKRLRVLGLGSFEEYVEFVENDETRQELSHMIDMLTTNKTNFFREIQHFNFLSKNILPNIISKKKLRFWSAGCSSGEEPYSLAIQLREDIPQIDRMDIKILATDISNRVLEKAGNGMYDADLLSDIPQKMLTKYFTRVSNSSPPAFQAQDSLKSLIQFARLNLLSDWPMQGPFDVIFCRNVMIYFNQPTRQNLINRFWELLAPGGFLFIGHSESLTNSSHNYRYIQPAIYQK